MTNPVLIPKCIPWSILRTVLKFSNSVSISKDARRARSGSFSWAIGARNSFYRDHPNVKQTDHATKLFLTLF